MAIFNESAGGPIPLPTARQWTANYRATITPGDTEAHYFGSNIILRLLNETGSVGIRIYYAIGNQGKKQLLLLGVDADGNNLLPQEGSVAEAVENEEGPIVVNHSFPCPPFCSSNPL